MPYEPTPEDDANVLADFEDLASAAEKAGITLEQMQQMHMACPVLHQMADGMIEQVACDEPVMRLLLLFNLQVELSLRIMCYYAYLIGQNSERYPTMLPCTEDHPDHLHEIENLLRKVAEEEEGKS